MDIPEIVEMRTSARERDEKHHNQNEEDDTDTEPDCDAKPIGDGPRGEGRPLEVGSSEKKRDLVDGLGNNSLGKWRPKDQLRMESK